MTRSAGSTGRSDTQRVILIEPSRLAPLLAGMKVWELAQMAGTSVDAVVEKIVRVAGLPAWPGMQEPGIQEPHPSTKGSSGPRLRRREKTPKTPPDLSVLPGRATLREVRSIVDRWVLGRVLEQSEWNLSQAAARLETSRRRLRDRWNVVRHLPVEPLVARLRGRSTPSPDDPSSPSLADLLERGASFREIRGVVEQWLVDRALEDSEGNVTQAASRLGISRKALRHLRDESSTCSAT